MLFGIIGLKGNETMDAEYMKGHPDSVTPMEILEDRLKNIDHYIYQLEKSGNTGTDFLVFYKNKSLEFQEAIKKLKSQ